MPKPAHSVSGPQHGFSYIIWGGAVFALIQSFSLLAPILLSFLLVILISLAVDPLVERLAQWTGGRTSATGLLAITVGMILALTGWAFLGPLTTSVSKLSQQVPEYWEKVQKPLIKIEQQAKRSEEKLQAEVKTEIAHITTNDAPNPLHPSPQSASSAPTQPESKTATSIRSGITPILQNLAGGFAGAAFNAAQIFFVMVTVAFGVLFTLINPRPVYAALYAIVPRTRRAKAQMIAKRISSLLPAWAGATALGMLTIGGLVFILMWPIFGPMDALLLGIIAGVFEAFPYIGPILSAIPALLFALIQGGNTPIWVVGAYIAVQALENNVILPYIMAKEMKLHPLAVIFAMLLSVLAFGVLGVVIAPPLVAIGEILYDELSPARVSSKDTRPEHANHRTAASHTLTP